MNLIALFELMRSLCHNKILHYVTQQQLWLTERLQINVLLPADRLLSVRDHFLKFLLVPDVERLVTTALETSLIFC